MADQSAIEWTDATWNPTTGCDRVSPGCARCYAKTLHDKRHKAFLNGWTSAPAQYHQPFEVVQIHPGRLEAPLHWSAPRMVFVDSVSDLFYGNAADERRCVAQGIPFHPVPFDFIDRVFAVMALGHQHTYQILTKRADRMLAYRCDPDQPRRVATLVVQWGPDRGFGQHQTQPHPETDIARVGRAENVWHGVSVENQRFADERIPLLLQTPAAVRFISAEPLLGPIVLKQENPDGYWPPNAPQPDVAWLRHKDWPDDFQYWTTGLNWVIVGGESGADARPFEPEWARSLVRQCQAAGVAVFVKQLGSHVIDRNDAGFEGDTPTSWPMDSVFDDDIAHFREQGAPVRVFLSKKGGVITEWPADLRVREFPTVPA